MTEIDTNWDVDYYRTDYESEEHWNLKKKFIEAHKANFEEDKLICLAQCFTNIEFMGCKYPDETMQLVANLALDVAQQFREERKSKLKRTFVQASDAAEQKAKRGRTTKSTTEGPSSSFHSKKQQLPFNKLKYKHFIYYQGVRPDFVMIKNSADRSKMSFDIKEYAEGSNKVVEFVLNGLILAKSKSTNMKQSKKQAFELAEAELDIEAITIRLNPKADQISISKDKGSILAVVEKQETAPLQIDSSNIGFKMMQKLGWSGGGLGSKKDGMEEPISLDFGQKTRHGLGAKHSMINEATNELNKNYCKQLLTDYCNSDELRDLKLTSAFSKDQRAYFHKLAASMPVLKSASHGKDEDRYLVLSKLIPPNRIAEEILLNNNEAFKNKYQIKVPDAWKDLFPNYTKPLN
ncbi:hypothetical protein ACFFRR_010768 [Megaselia abdita]